MKLQTIALALSLSLCGMTPGCKTHSPDAIPHRQFKVGDIVHLKSGGPRMTVSGYAYGAVCVDWMDDIGQNHYFRYNEQLLVKGK